MKNILVTAGGTATAWHIASIVDKYFSDEIRLVVCDINDPDLVPASTKAAKCYQVPYVSDPSYIESIERIIKDESIDCIIPLIPEEALFFAKDSEFSIRNRIDTTCPRTESINKLANKQNMFHALKDLDIPTPRLYGINEVESEKEYIVKPKFGFGSLGVERVKGETILHGAENFNLDERVIQELCRNDDYDEITVEVYNEKAGLHIFPRRRIATKAGVCVKMEPVDPKAFYPSIKKLVENIACPVAFNVQYLFHDNTWKLFDCNLRLGAGTALSTAIGFQLTRALLHDIVGDDILRDLFEYDKSVKKVLRVYEEILVK